MAQLFAALRLRQAIIFRWTLLSMPLLDELISGFPVVGLPLLRDQLGLSYDQVGLLFSVGALSGMVIEPFINILSDRTSKRYWVIGGLLALSASFVLAGSSNNFIVLLAAFTLMFPANSAGSGLSEATLIDALPQESMQTMARWTLMASIGDLLSPLTVAAIITLPLVLPTWTTLCWLAAALWLGGALFVWPQRFPSKTHVIP
ncbi:MAG: MFS transporter [Chloroflexi bacterium]|nr:MAG: MFS transporter [Chloroflexota bacterium]